MKILVTGGGGQLATALAGLDGWSPNGGGHGAIVARGIADLDITSPDDIARAFRHHQPDVVINAAAYTAVDAAETDVKTAMSINADGPRHLASACRTNDVRLVQISTDFVFDGTAHSPIPTGAPTGAISNYGLSKERGDDAVREVLGEDALIVRTAWVYASGHPNFVASMLRLMRSREEIGVVSDQLGTPTWSMTLASSLLEMIDRDAAGTWHLTDSGVASWYDFAVAIREISEDIGLMTHRCEVRPIRTIDFPTPARRPAYGVLDKTSTFELLGGPTPHWRESLARCLSEWSDPT